MKRQIMGREVVVAVTGGKLDFGPWEQIFYGEFDGGRRKRVLISANRTAAATLNRDRRRVDMVRAFRRPPGLISSVNEKNVTI